MEERFGEKQVVSVGTYTTLKLKSALKDLDRQLGNDVKLANLATSIIDDKDSGMAELFKRASKEPRLKEYVKKNSDIFYMMPSILNQPKAKSIHPCSVIITPDMMESKEWFPIRKQKGILVSDWGGGEMEQAGFLKQDILAIKQLDKFADILKLVKNNGKEVPNIYNLPYSQEVYRYFGNGWNGDVFQMGTEGLSGYTRYMKPQDINDLVAVVALYRPGAMENNFHNIYVQCKNEGRQPEYLWGTEEITKDTFGILCLDGNSNILTPSGTKKIKNLKIGDSVFNEDREVDEVTNHIYSGKKDTIKINGSFGEQLILTKEHKVLTQYGWVEAGKLNPSKHLIKSYWINNKEKVDKGDSEIENLRDWLIGFFLAEGSARCTPYFTVGTEYIANRLISIIKTVYPDSFPRKTYTRNPGRPGGSWRVYVKFTESKVNSNKSKNFKPNRFANLLREYGIWNTTCYNKKFPKKYSIHTLSGLIEGDGCLKNSSLRLCNKDLCYGAFLALDSYRIQSNFREISDKVFQTRFSKSDKFVFRILEGKLSNFKSYIPCEDIILNRDVDDYKIRKRFFTKGVSKKIVSKSTCEKYGDVSGYKHGLWCKIDSISDYGNIDTFDISVKNKHSFISGGLVVHNCYQEQIAQICSQIGGLNMSEADDVRKAMGKKKLSALLPWKERIQKGYLERGATEDDFTKAWEVMVEFTKYSFNKSHSVAYAETGYISQYLKVHYPLEYWTVALGHSDEEKGLKYLSEIFMTGEIEVAPPDINKSKITMTSDEETNTIYWGIESIKGIGEATAEQIIDIRNSGGRYTSFANFVFRNSFKGSKVKKQTFEALISAGAFDKLYGFNGDEQKRMSLINRYRIHKKVKVSNPKTDIYTIGNTEDKWWWKLTQKRLTGLVFVDYSEIVKRTSIETQFVSNGELSQHQNRGIFRAFGGYVVEYKIRSSSRGRFATLTIESNYNVYRIMLWNDEYERFKKTLQGCEKSFIVFDAEIKYEDKWTKGNQFTLKENSQLIVLK